MPRLIAEVFKDHPGQTNVEEDTGRGGKKKKGGGKTVSSFYKEQLTNLMTTLHATEPHFIRLNSHLMKVLFRVWIDRVTCLLQMHRA